MTKSQFFAKLETFQTLIASGLVTAEGLQQAVKTSIENKELKPLRAEAFEDKPAELLAFATEIGLVKVPRERSVRSDSTVGKRSDILPLVQAQYPEHIEKIQPAIDLAGTIFEVEVDGKTERVAFQPFWRRIKPKKEKLATGTAQAGQVAI